MQDVTKTDGWTLLAGLRSRLAASGEFNVPQVERIKALLARGHYRVSPDAIADKVIESTRELLRARAQPPRDGSVLRSLQ